MALTALKSKPHTIHHKKRTGTHRRHTSQYVKPYWPYLPLVLIAVLGFVGNSLWSGVHKNVLGYATDISASTLLADTNTQRTTSQQAALTFDGKLAAAAQAKADDMAARNYWSHVSPDGRQPWNFVAAAHYSYSQAGENLAYGFGTSQQIIRGWMNSPEHRANLLNAGFRDVGFGIANAPHYQGHGPQTIVVALYGTPATAPVSQTGASSDAAGAARPRSSAPAVLSSASPPVAIARVQVVHAPAPLWLLAAACIGGVVAATLFTVRHWLFIRRALVRGEAFVIRHKALDIIIVSIMVLSVVLTRTAGFIR